MKKLFITMLLVSANVCIGLAQKSNNVCSVIGHFTDSKVSSVILYHAQQKDTVSLEAGEFKKSFNSDAVCSVIIVNYQPSKKGNDSNAEMMRLVTIPGVPLMITGTFSNYKMTGCKTYEAYGSLQNKMKATNAEISKLESSYEDIMAKAKDKKVAEKVISAKFDSLEKINIDFALSYIKAHPDNEESALLIPLLRDKYETGVNTLSSKVKSGRMASYYLPFIKFMEKRKAMEDLSSKLSHGKLAPDFTLKDIKGGNFKLSSLRGKYVVLDFWGSWCGWCIKAIPNIKKYYEKYKGKLEIVGVDCNDTEVNWKNAVAKYQIPWLHVKNEKDANDVTLKYGVMGYPTLVIIAPDGKILKIYQGEKPDFFTTLDSLLK
jgi:thiol-disulfide isomerase/thioredoxin